LNFSSPKLSIGSIDFGSWAISPSPFFSPINRLSNRSHCAGNCILRGGVRAATTTYFPHSLCESFVSIFLFSLIFHNFYYKNPKLLPLNVKFAPFYDKLICCVVGKHKAKEIIFIRSLHNQR